MSPEEGLNKSLRLKQAVDLPCALSCPTSHLINPVEPYTGSIQISWVVSVAKFCG